jgi:hypothetical protein
MARTDVNLECTFDIAADGAVYQFMPVDIRADCNAQANGFAISVETQDRGSATLNTTPWTREQCAAIVKLLVWLRDTWNIPMWRASQWNGSGVGAHRDFPEWSSSAHSCPGDARFAQVPALIATAADYGQMAPSNGYDMLYCKDAGTGEFWAIYFDGTGHRVVCPLAEMPDPDWDEFADVQAAFGPLVAVPHAALQRLYDKRGRPSVVTGTVGPAGPVGAAGPAAPPHHHTVDAAETGES